MESQRKELPQINNALVNPPTIHHVPPLHPNEFPQFLKKRKREKEYRAYVTIFGSIGTYEGACKLLWEKWWKNPNVELFIHPDTQPRFKIEVDDEAHKAYNILFHAAKSYEDTCIIIWHDWWATPEQQEEAAKHIREVMEIPPPSKKGIRVKTKKQIKRKRKQEKRKGQRAKRDRKSGQRP